MNSSLLARLQHAISLHNGGQLGAAETIYRQVLALDGGQPDALHLLAHCLHLQQRHGEALPVAERAVGRHRSALFLNTLAEIQRALGQNEAAMATLERALALQPEHGDALHNLALLQEQQGNRAAAIALFERACAVSGAPLYRANRLALLLREHRNDEAGALYGDLLARLDAGTPEPAFQIAFDALRRAHRRAEALHLAERWRACRPASVLAARCHAASLVALHREREAEPTYRELFDAGLVSAALCVEAGDACHLGGRPEQAIAYYRRGLELDPASPPLRRALAGVLIEEGRLAEGLAEMRRLLADQPDNPQWRFDLGFYLLQNQDFEEGWRRFEDRLLLPRLVSPAIVWPAEKRWPGGDCAGKTLLVWEDEGIGDTIQNLRFLPALRQRGARLTLVLRPGLQRLAELAGQAIEIVDAAAAAGRNFDFNLPIMSLPARLSATPGTIDREPYLAADAADRAAWNSRLAAAGASGQRVGICWAGNPIHANDPWRSIPAAELNVLGRRFSGCWVSLQRERRDEGLPDLPGLIDWTDALADLADTAALIANLDLVICVDSAIAHLAAALGVPTWILLPRNSDWRWGQSGEDSYWYRSVRLFRQPVLGDWTPVLEAVGAALSAPEKKADALTGKTPAKRAGTTPAVAPAGRNYTLVSGRHGRLLVNRNDRFVGRSLIEYGEFSEDEIGLMSSYLSADSVIVEAGANIGALTLPLAARVPHGRLLAFEPQRLVFQLLCANLALNELANVDAHWAALGAQPGQIAIPDLPPSVRENFGGVAAGQGSSSVALTTIDGLALGRLDLIKIDVEGMELEVVRGALNSIARCRPVMYIENDRRDKSAALIGQLLALDYRLYWHTPPLFSPDNYFGQANNVFGQLLSGNLLCLPAEKALPCTLRPVAGAADWPLAD